jgi:hypothetical protein
MFHQHSHRRGSSGTAFLLLATFFICGAAASGKSKTPPPVNVIASGSTRPWESLVGPLPDLVGNVMGIALDLAKAILEQRSL